MTWRLINVSHRGSSCHVPKPNTCKSHMGNYSNQHHTENRGISHFHKNIALIARQCSTNDWNCTNCEVVNNNITDFNIYFLSSNNGRRYYYFLHINTSTIITITKYRQWYGNDRALYISWSASMMRTGQNPGPQTWFTNQSSCDWCKS